MLTNFRNHAATWLSVGPQPVVLTGANGSGKTNILEAVSLLSPGQGLRRAPFVDLARAVGAGDGSWTLSARVHTAHGVIDIGTGQTASPETTERTGRIVRINGEASTSGGAC